MSDQLDPSRYPVADDELVNHDPFYRRPIFYIPFISLLLILCLAVVVFQPFGPMPTIVLVSRVPPTPYYDQERLVFPDGTTDWNITPQTNNSYGYFICKIDGEWHKCYPVYK